LTIGAEPSYKAPSKPERAEPRPASAAWSDPAQALKVSTGRPAERNPGARPSGAAAAGGRAAPGAGSAIAASAGAADAKGVGALKDDIDDIKEGTGAADKEGPPERGASPARKRTAAAPAAETTGEGREKRGARAAAALLPCGNATIKAAKEIPRTFVMPSRAKGNSSKFLIGGILPRHDGRRLIIGHGGPGGKRPHVPDAAGLWSVTRRVSAARFN
jgi:hypothetical protein